MLGQSSYSIVLEIEPNGSNNVIQKWRGRPNNVSCSACDFPLPDRNFQISETLKK